MNPSQLRTLITFSMKQILKLIRRDKLKTTATKCDEIQGVTPYIYHAMIKKKLSRNTSIEFEVRNVLEIFDRFVSSPKT